MLRTYQDAPIWVLLIKNSHRREEKGGLADHHLPQLMGRLRLQFPMMKPGLLTNGCICVYCQFESSQKCWVDS